MTKLAIVAVVLLAACSKDKGEAAAKTEEPQAPKAGDIPQPPPPEPEEESAFDKLMVMEKYEDALAFALPTMQDDVNEQSAGTIAFAVWAGHKLRWTDVAVEKNETSVKLVMKDSDEARGKRMCVSGKLIEIEKASKDPVLFEGGLTTSSYDIVRFLAAGSTGELVKGDRGRICGVVTGRYSYSNAGGGTTHAVMLVGMFDLPENRPPK